MAKETSELRVPPVVEPFETQGERRRAQIVAITAKLVIAGGPEAVSHSAVAERAGLVRTAVYRYFPTRDELLAAVLTELSRVHSSRISAHDAAIGFRELARGSRKRIPPATRMLLEKLWDPEDWSEQSLEVRLAAVILQRDTELLTRLQATHPQLAAQQAIELTQPLGELNLEPIEIRIVIDTILTVLYHASVAALAGTIDRERAMLLTYRTIHAAVHAYLP
jgi:AcrR family transcriptional regulator